MGSTMLIDAAHPEETRVVVQRGNKIEEFDYESSSRKQIRGNIYLAKVTRVEPSLQAAFVDYGGNRHGFLAFSEIHPDYYQIPVADRQALLREESRSHRASDEEDDKSGEEAAEPTSERDGNGAAEGNGEAREARAKGARRGRGEDGEASVEEIDEDPEAQAVDSVGADDALEEASFRRNVKRVYKIQEVIKRRQILLVQVVKEERGNKGAALTTYLSLAGRYCVLMPNTARGGGISRKITDASDRRRLKEVAREMEVPEGMGVIVRTAGANRTKAEIKRDYDYLLRQWESIRDLTLKSTAPTLIYEEGSLIKRAIRDLYTKDIEQILVEGAAAHREARDFMKMLMPSHARNVRLYQESRPLFSRYQVESQLDGLFSPVVTLSSGGYIVINQTEALVSIDVNSGKSTREHNIEDTALKTNLEAADEIARQLRLRDLAGLIVIDFIDMEEKRNNRAVERRMKEALKNDRARIQVGRISHFGLLEMSRQRLRVGMLEGSTVPCPTCLGRGIIRSIESCALSVLRGMEEHLMRRAEDITLRCDPNVAFYLLNQKRHHVLSMEQIYNASIYLEASEELHNENFKIERAEGRPARPIAAAVQVDTAFTEAARAVPEPEPVDEEEDLQVEADLDEAAIANDAREHAGPRHERNGRDGDDAGRRRRRRRGRRGGKRNRIEGETTELATDAGQWRDPGAGPQPDLGNVEIPEFEAELEWRPEPGRNRQRRGTEAPMQAAEAENVGDLSVELSEEVIAGPLADQAAGADEIELGVVASAETEATSLPSAGETETQADEEQSQSEAAEAKPAKRPRRTRAAKTGTTPRSRSAKAKALADTAEAAEEAPAAAEEPSEAKPKRRSRAKSKSRPAGEAKSEPVTVETADEAPQLDTPERRVSDVESEPQDEAPAAAPLSAEAEQPAPAEAASAPLHEDTHEAAPETHEAAPEPHQAAHAPADWPQSREGTAVDREPALNGVTADVTERVKEPVGLASSAEPSAHIRHEAEQPKPEPAQPRAPKEERPARRGWWQRARLFRH